jgi:hypothetical protein
VLIDLRMRQKRRSQLQSAGEKTQSKAFDRMKSKKNSTRGSKPSRPAEADCERFLRSKSGNETERSGAGDQRLQAREAPPPRIPRAKRTRRTSSDAATKQFQRNAMKVLAEVAEERSRLVTALLGAGWFVRTQYRKGKAPLPQLRHPDKRYALSFYGCGIQRDGHFMIPDCRGWSIDELLTYCDAALSSAKRKRLVVAKDFYELEPGVIGIPSDIVFAEAGALLHARFDKKRKSPPPIPAFASPKQEQAFWNAHDVLLYFGEPDLLRELR